jgi:propionyl-CoA synthetase
LVAENMLNTLLVPMIPQALIALLAICRLGAIHAVVFGGFAATSLAQRIDASTPRLILTASCAVEGSKGAISYQPMIEGAVEQSKHKVEKVVVWQREELRWSKLDEHKGEKDWAELVSDCRRRGKSVKENVPVKSDDGIYIIYTSGTTGKNLELR